MSIFVNLRIKFIVIFELANILSIPWRLPLYLRGYFARVNGNKFNPEFDETRLAGFDEDKFDTDFCLAGPSSIFPAIACN